MIPHSAFASPARRIMAGARSLAFSMLAIAPLAACGPGGTAAPPAPPSRPAPTAEETARLLASLPAPYDSADLENGRRAFARCRACHTVTEGGANLTGPNLWAVFERAAGTEPRYNYSQAVKTAGFVWDAERLDHWLENPRGFLPGNRMAFGGLPDAGDRRDLIAWLKVNTGYAAPEAPSNPG